jgi:integrase/recombinase XerD
MRKAPRGCFWRNGRLYGRTRINQKLYRWDLHTDDPKVARKRQAEGKARLIAGVFHGDSRLTFDEVMNSWSTWIEGQVAPRTVARYADSLERIGSHVRGQYLDQIDGRLIAEIIRLRSAEVSNATVKRDLCALSSVMNFAIDQGWAEFNPVLPRMRRVKERRDPIVLPQPATLDILLGGASGTLQNLIRAARATGARLSELVYARRPQLDLGRRRLEVIGKGNKRRVIDLEPFDGWRAFSDLPASTEWLFWHVHEGKAQPYKNVSSRMGALMRDLKIDPRFSFHDLRHLHAVEWLQSGRSIYDLQQRLGHTSVKTTEIYLQFLTPEEKRTAMGLVSPAVSPTSSVS